MCKITKDCTILHKPNKTLPISAAAFSDHHLRWCLSCDILGCTMFLSNWPSFQSYSRYRSLQDSPVPKGKLMRTVAVVVVQADSRNCLSFQSIKQHWQERERPSETEKKICLELIPATSQNSANVSHGSSSSWNIARTFFDASCSDWSLLRM